MRDPQVAPPRSTISTIRELPAPLRSMPAAIRERAAPRRSTLPVLLALALPAAACGNVGSSATPDAPIAPIADAAPDTTAPGADAALNRCAPATCLLADEFDGASLDPSIWALTLQGGATAKVSNGTLTLHLPATPEAFADVYSLVGFPAGTTFLASVTFSSGQFYDHKGVGFSSSGITADCFSGETEAAMFRGQDGDSYLETKLAGTATCTLMTKDYQAGTHAVKIVRDADRVVFTQNDVALDPITSHVPTGLLPIRFTAYTYETAPGAAVEIVVDWVAVLRN
jgi:hypothetical protein